MHKFHDDFRRAHMDTLVRQIICTDVLHDDKTYDSDPFPLRYRKTQKSLYKDLRKFLNASDTNTSHLTVDQRLDMYLDIAADSFDKMFHLFFEAGMQSGILFSLDMAFIGKSDLAGRDGLDGLDKDVSILRQLLENATTNA